MKKILLVFTLFTCIANAYAMDEDKSGAAVMPVQVEGGGLPFISRAEALAASKQLSVELQKLKGAAEESLAALLTLYQKPSDEFVAWYKSQATERKQAKLLENDYGTLDYFGHLFGKIWPAYQTTMEVIACGSPDLRRSDGKEIVVIAGSWDNVRGILWHSLNMLIDARVRTAREIPVALGLYEGGCASEECLSCKTLLEGPIRGFEKDNLHLRNHLFDGKPLPERETKVLEGVAGVIATKVSELMKACDAVMKAMAPVILQREYEESDS